MRWPTDDAAALARKPGAAAARRGRRTRAETSASSSSSPVFPSALLPPPPRRVSNSGRCLLAVVRVGAATKGFRALAGWLAGPALDRPPSRRAPTPSQGPVCHAPPFEGGTRAPSLAKRSGRRLVATDVLPTCIPRQLVPCPRQPALALQPVRTRRPARQPARRPPSELVPVLSRSSHTLRPPSPPDALFTLVRPPLGPVLPSLPPLSSPCSLGTAQPDLGRPPRLASPPAHRPSLALVDGAAALASKHSPRLEPPARSIATTFPSRTSPASSFAAHARRVLEEVASLARLHIVVRSSALG